MLQAKNLISETIPAIRSNEKGLKALNWMEIFRISHLPIIDENDIYLGLISDNDIYDFQLADEKLESHIIGLRKVFVYENQHIFKVIEIMSGEHLSAIPVLSEKNKFLGVITLFDLVKQMSSFISADIPGAFFVLEINRNDYSLSHLSQIIENNNAKIISLYVNPLTHSTKLEVTIKINTVDFTTVHFALERFGYIVKSSFSEKDLFQEAIDERFDEFINYMNI